MSEVFEGVLYPVEPGSGAQPTVRHGVPFEVHDLEPGLRVVYRSDSRQDAAFSEDVDRLAGELSGQHGRSLVVRFDSRIGHRSAALYLDRQPALVFGEADELYVPLDEQGLPRREAEPLRADQLAPEEEYETIQNAIEQGLKAFGLGNWDELLRFMTAG